MTILDALTYLGVIALSGLTHAIQTSSATSCVTTFQKCGGRSYTGNTSCCDSDTSCFVKDQSYSQCRPSCPSGTGWACDLSSTLREAGLRRNISIGGVVKYKNLISSEDGVENYTEIMQREFNFFTAENGCKWRYANTKNHLWCDNDLDFAIESGASFRLHALVWGQASSNPDFFCEDCVDPLPSYCESYVGNWSKAEKRRIMIEHVTNHTLRYLNKEVAAIDVVNEAVCDCTPTKYDTCADYLAGGHEDKCGYSELYDTYLKKNIYWPDIPDYIGLALTTAKNTNPDVRVGYNDYKFEAGVGWQAEKSSNVYNLVKSLLAQNVSIDYVGLQTHIDLGYANYTGYLSGVRNYTQSLADLGVQVDFTEVTIACQEDCTTTWDDYKENVQANLYAGLLDICIDQSNCTVFQMWGGIDGWSKAYSGLKAYPFDVNYQPKKAWYAMMDLLDGSTYHTYQWEAMQTESSGTESSGANRNTVKQSPASLSKACLLVISVIGIILLGLYRATRKIAGKKRRGGIKIEMPRPRPYVVHVGRPATPNGEQLSPLNESG